MTALIEIKNLSYEYRDEGITFLALKNINLTINYGEFIAITGASGSGKSTLLNVIGILGAATDGEYYLAGTEVTALSEEEKSLERSKRIGFVFQQFNLLNRLSAFENTLLPSRFLDKTSFTEQKNIQHTALNLYHALKIEDKLANLPKALSGGQKQRVAVARALLLNPDIILADEPTGALDGQSTKELLDIFCELNRQGKTVIIITHDPHVALRAKRRIILKDGHIESDYLQDPPLASELTDFDLYRNSPAPNRNKFVENLQNYILLPLLNSFAGIGFALKTLYAHRMRSFLTGLGLLIGVISIIFVFGLGIVAERAFSKLFMRPATQRVYVMLDFRRGSKSTDRYWGGMEPEREFPRFVEMFSKYGKISPFFSSSVCKITSNSTSTKTKFQGQFNLEEFMDIDTSLESGRYPTSFEIDKGTPLAILGSDAVNNLFSDDYAGRANPHFPLGEKIYATECNVAKVFTIIGVLKKQDLMFMRTDANDLIYTSTQALMSGSSRVYRSGFSAKPNKGVDPAWLAKSIANYLGLKADGRVTFATFVPQEILAKLTAMLDVITYFTGFIGALCILVGGIGIMNIMLVSVRERVREIGLQKSLGAKPAHIRKQFLTECITLCVISGIIGIGAGLIFVNIIAFGAAKFLPSLGAFEPIFAVNGIILSLAVSFASGICFGYFPAFKAMQVNPVECLREE